VSSNALFYADVKLVSFLCIYVGFAYSYPPMISSASFAVMIKKWKLEIDFG